jgi:DNA helicase HerA-like ATPase
MIIGKLISVDYSILKVKVSSSIRGGTVNLHGDVYYFGNIGSYLKICNAIHEVIICEVISISDVDLYKEKSSFDTESNRELIIRPLGTVKGADFSLGVGIYPSIYSDVSIISYDDMEIILNIDTSRNQENEVKKIHRSFPLGVSKNLINYPIDVGINEFFNIHTAILGNSGSGKSNTIAHIIQQIHKMNDYSSTGARILMFDVNGEYKTAFEKNDNENINIKYYKPNISKETDGYKPFVLPHFLLNIEEWSAFLLATNATQRPFWSKVLQESYRFFKLKSSNSKELEKFENYLRYRVCSIVLSVLNQADTDTARITTASSILGSIRSLIGKDAVLKANTTSLLSEISLLQKNCTINYGENNSKLENSLASMVKKINYELVEEVESTTIRNGEYFDYKYLKTAAEMVLLEEDAKGNGQIRGFTATMMTRLEYFLENEDCEFMRADLKITSGEDYLKKLWTKGSKKAQLIIIDTSELGPDVLETLTSVTSRLLFDERKRLLGKKRRENPVHLILDEAHRYIKNGHDYILKENIFDKIAREGRKYSFYLLVSSQRPSELSETVLSQCANFIIHRIQNEKDMNYIRAILPYFSDDFVNKIKQSTPGEALVFGNCVSMPLHLKIHPSNPSPNSENCNISEEWFKPNIPDFM